MKFENILIGVFLVFFILLVVTFIFVLAPELNSYNSFCDKYNMSSEGGGYTGHQCAKFENGTFLDFSVEKINNTIYFVGKTP